jgi:mannose-6-phosphate isomerase-like protein (cupin superfamily)
VTDPKKPRGIETEEAKRLGIWTEHAEMPNGELRFRLKHRDGTAYIRTESKPSSGWQKSHYHDSVRETYIVQEGRIALAEWIDERLRLRMFGAGGSFTTEPRVPHNIYMFGGSIIHTVKHGPEGKVADWHAVPTLDERTVSLDEDAILRLTTS